MALYKCISDTPQYNAGQTVELDADSYEALDIYRSHFVADGAPVPVEVPAPYDAPKPVETPVEATEPHAE